jgi:1-acyl-sn-glycerol-3-phosphate acyltransferase
MSALRSIAFNVWFFGTLTVFLLFMWVLLPFPYRMLLATIRAWVRLALGGLRVIVGLDWEVRGLERMPDGPVIIASKHQSAWDTVAPLLLFPDAAWVMKKELSQIPFWGWYARKCGSIFVDRSAGPSALKKLAAESEDRMGKGRPVLIFPEGTRTSPGEPPRYAPGVAALYKQANVPVVPVALNSGVFWGRRSFVKKPGTIVIEVLDPIPPGLDRKAFMTTLEERVETASARLVDEARALDQA